MDELLEETAVGFYPRQTIETIDGTCEFNVLIVNPSSSMNLSRVVVLSDIPHSRNMGITGHLEQIATEVRKRFLLSPFRTTWIEHQHPNTLWGDKWWLVDFTWDMPQVTCNPSWMAYCGNWQEIGGDVAAGLMAPHYDKAKELMSLWLSKEGEYHVA